MIATIMAVVALSGSLAPAAKPEFQAQTDYGQALRMAADEKKPVAVLIGKGDGFAKLMAGSDLSADAKKLLTEKYVCLSVNVETTAGKALADQFQLTDGLVISSAGGTHQAFRQSGTVSPTELGKQVATYASAGVPAATVTAGTVAPTTVYPAGTTFTPAPATVYPAGYTYPTAPVSPPVYPYPYSPAGSPSFAPIYRSPGTQCVGYR
jgi:hypothetical protein